MMHEAAILMADHLSVIGAQDLRIPDVRCVHPKRWTSETTILVEVVECAACTFGDPCADRLTADETRRIDGIVFHVWRVQEMRLVERTPLERALDIVGFGEVD